MGAFAVRVPASSANLGSGVDCMGLALSRYLTVCFESAKKTEAIFADGFDAPVPQADNLILRGARRIFEKAGEAMPALRMTARTEIPISRGMGSSASAIIAGVCGANMLLGNRFSTDDLLNEAADIEGHPDNVVPCLLGGLTVAMQSGGRVFVRRTSFPAALRIAVCVPDFKLSTQTARGVLPKDVPLAAATGQLARACFLTASLFGGGVLTDLDKASADALFTPARTPLIPGFSDAAREAREAGALCAMISGAGPSVAAFTSPADAASVCAAMVRGFAGAGIRAVSFDLSADNAGAKIINL
ncbi:MAG: homoserine kinase [Oscillospiraceae bacterium]|nr:homoserine kinase [Oscillospiraceae bacterium]